ncbi:uncharacterized protein OCT59_008143 [Rhizophagus irregularis]|uniref:Uncharacterized protein n=3 Tax=Rhizophagus irregularis TaxID=588596 RepID=A0A2I1E4Z8_9GLOM|nr:hypothetical protein RhiirB3_403954 [Rhizophagus irregularis]UZO16766.1 hypothetical protein OCT59_008143 [Rhizophagus irregularis]GBC42768.2 hypothetical protein GLOIN_2v1730968 [Rhizophagus irregularis DAOM 181602=DAOM 197198]CAB4475861.1 unnamed protein product [Rhizophagus irregularis]CAB5363854.1 unnamed protein product [Rhizophagus irregularis]
MSQYSHMQDNAGSLYAQYPTPDNTLSSSSPSQPRTPGTLQSSQSNTTQLLDSFLSDVPQGAYSECSTLDNSSAIPTIIQDSSDLAPHTPESILYSSALDVSLGDERTDLNVRKQRGQPPILRRSPRISSNQTPQTSEQQSDSASLESQDSSNNCELINKSPAALAFEVLDESTDLLLSEQEKNTLNSRNLDNSRTEQEFSTSLVDTENRDINELRDLITTSNMILDSVHHSSVSYKNHEVDNEMEDIEYTQTTGTFKQPHEVSQSELEREHENENEYPESVDFVIANEISDTLFRQSEHYNNMASKFSNLKFIKVEPESEEEIEQFANPIAPGVRRSTRKRTTVSYSYPRYSYGSSKRSKTRKKRRSLRKGTLSVTENEADVDSEVVNVDNEKNEETDEPVHNLPVQSDEEQETSEDSHGIQNVGDGGNIDENILDNYLQDNLYLKHDLRSRKIMLALPGVVDNSEETEKEPVSTAFSKKITRPKQLAKKTILKNTSKKSVKTIPKRRTSRRSTSRKKNEDREWHPDEADNELGDDSETVMANSRGRGITSKARLSSKTSTTPKKSKKVESIDAISEVSTKRRLSGKKAPKISKTSKITRKEKKPAQDNRGRGKSRSEITRGSRPKNHDTSYKYSGGEETESEIEISEVVDTVDNNSENQIVEELSNAEIEHNIAVVEESVSTPTRPKRIRKSKSSVSEPLTHTPKSSRSTRSTRSHDVNKRDDRKVANTEVDDDIISNTHEQSDDVPEVQVDLTPSAQPKKTPRSTRVKKRSARVGGNTATGQPIDPSIIEVSAGNRTTLENAVRALSEKNFEVVTNLQSEDVYREKFYDFGKNNRESSSEPSGDTQRRNSIESSSSRDSKSYSNLRNGSKRKRSESNATTIPKGKKKDNNKEEGETEDKVSKRHRVEGNASSGSGTTPSSQNMNISQTSPNNSSSILKRLLGGWFYD